MRKSPLPITIIAVIHFLYPVAYIFQMLFLDHRYIMNVCANKHIVNCLGLYFKVALAFPNGPYTLRYIEISCLAILVGLGLFMVKMWGYYMFLLVAVYTLSMNIYQTTLKNYISPISSFFTIFCTLFTLLLMGYLIRREFKSPYFNPTSKRLKKNIEIGVKLVKGNESISGKLYDISSNGLYLTLENISEVTLGRIYDIDLYLLTHKPIYVLGEIVSISEGSKEAPKGIGIRFKKILRTDEKKIETFLKIKH